MAKKKQKKQGGGQQFLSPEQYLRQRARSLEIGTCYVTNDIDEMRMGYVIVTRRHTGGRISMALYLVDMACLGVKDSFYRLRMEDYEFDELLDDRRDMFRECSYDEAHNRVWGSVAYAEEAGIRPDKSFLLTQYMLEEDTDDIPLIEYEYGKDGKHFLTCRSELEASRYLPLLKKNLGEGNYHYIIGIGDPGFDDEEYYEDDEDYDDDTKTLWNLPVGNLDMADIVKAKPVTGIKIFSLFMGLDLHGLQDEEEMRRRYVDYILTHPAELLCRLPEFEVSILLYIGANRNKATGVPTANTRVMLMMELLGMADCYFNNSDEFCVRVADDFLQVALPIAAKINMRDECRQRYEVEAVIEGMANLYGEVTLEDAKRAVMMHRGGFRSEAGQLIDRVRESSLLLYFMMGKVDETRKGIMALADDNVVFTSRYGWNDPADLRKAIGKRPPMPTQPFTDDGARRFTDDEIIEAGSGEVPTIPNERQQEMWHFLTRELQWDDYYARRICFDLWYKANHADDPAYDDTTIEQYFEDEALSCDVTQEEHQKGMRLLADYVAHIPRWTLKGHAPAE